jgi:CRISPR-associated endoribonuclease Cas6
MKFQIHSIDKRSSKIQGNTHFTLITGTPIVIRIPREKYKMYGIDPAKDYDYIYWRQGHPITLFLSQLQNNLVKKFIEFSDLNNTYEILKNDQPHDTVLSPSIFQKFTFKKQISTRTCFKGLEQVIIGTTWKFDFDTHANTQLIGFGLDCGLGERNSLGFGFMNLL